MNDRKEFVKAAMVGLLAGDHRMTVDTVSSRAVAFGDATLRALGRVAPQHVAETCRQTTHDAAPAADELVDVHDCDNRGPAVVVTGSVIGGFEFTGPFPTISAANEWYTQSMLGGIGVRCSIVLLVAPQPGMHVAHAATAAGRPAATATLQPTAEYATQCDWFCIAADGLSLFPFDSQEEAQRYSDQTGMRVARAITECTTRPTRGTTRPTRGPSTDHDAVGRPAATDHDAEPAATAPIDAMPLTVAPMTHGEGTGDTRSAQEPVAWGVYRGDTIDRACTSPEVAESWMRSWPERCYRIVPLYAAPAAKEGKR